MAKPNTFDVWFVTADQVYKGVPFQVVSGWVEQGRVAVADKVRPAGTVVAWQAISDHPLLADYLPGNYAPTRTLPGITVAGPTGPVEAPEPEFLSRKHADDDDDDVDMIPLIDISLVLLVFFMMTTAVAALSPVEVPGISSGAESSTDGDAITVQIDIRDSGEAYYGIRVGEQSISRENNNLDTLTEAMARLDAVLRQTNRPPEVRIACHKKLKHLRVREVAAELEKRKAKQQIAFYTAEVNEQKK